jgi:hypothetical protein
MADMPEQATVPNTYFEVNMDYTGPSAKIWVERVLVVQDMFDAFQPWNMSIDDMEVITSGKPSEQGLRFKFPAKAATFFVGLASCKFTRDNTSWETAGETIAILDPGRRGLSHRCATSAIRPSWRYRSFQLTDPSGPTGCRPVPLPG